jgi:hypothetical protein
MQEHYGALLLSITDERWQNQRLINKKVTISDSKLAICRLGHWRRVRRNEKMMMKVEGKEETRKEINGRKRGRGGGDKGWVRRE